jgi:hypothetical protein
MKLIEVTSTDTGYTKRVSRREFDEHFGVAEGKEILAGYLPNIVAVEIEPTLHAATLCEKVDGSGQYSYKNWSFKYRCPVCRCERKYNKNFLGQRVIVCVGTKAEKLTREAWALVNGGAQ